MTTLRRIVLCCLVLLSLTVLSAPMAMATPERAIDLLDVPVPYTADFYVKSDRGHYRGTVWHARGKERREFETEGGSQAVLLRRDTNTAYLMKPANKWYVGLNFQAVSSLAGGLDNLMVERKRMDSETVNGIRATRFQVSTAARGARFEGDAWFTGEGVLVKAEGMLTDAKGRTNRVETGLTNLRLGRLDDKTFELPGGWFGMDLRSVPPEQVEKTIQSLKPLLESSR